MTQPPKKPQLSEQQRAELKAIVKAVVREKLDKREDLRDQAAVMREVWKALVASPKWSMVTSERPEGTPTNEIWTMTPTVNKP